jgi:hypothetical protein
MPEDAFRPMRESLGRDFRKLVALPPGSRAQFSREKFPTLATFGDVSDPTSVRLLEPDEMGSVFGPGYRLARAEIEMVHAGLWPFNSYGITGSPLTREMERRLPTILARVRQLDQRLQVQGMGIPFRVRSGHLSAGI